MTDLVKNTSLTAEAIDNLVGQFKDTPQLEGLVASFVDQIQDTEDAQFQILVTLDLDTQVGAQLDGIGDILVTPRAGLGDDDYRTRLRVQIRIILSDGTVEDILSVLSIVETSTIEIRRVGSAEMSIQIFEITADPVQLALFISESRAAGVFADLVFSVLPESALFIWTSAPSVATTTQGWSNITQTNGGAFSAVIEA